MLWFYSSYENFLDRYMFGSISLKGVCLCPNLATLCLLLLGSMGNDVVETGESIGWCWDVVHSCTYCH
jgi:hypothetical protein